MTANDWILPWFMLVRIMYIMLNWIWVMRSDFPVVVITSGFQNIKPLLFHDWPVHTGYRLAGMQVCRLPHLPCVEESGWQTACKWTPPLSINTSDSLREWVHSGIRNGYVSMKSGDRCWMNITMSPQQPMLSVTKAIPFQSGIFADVWRVTQERYYQVKKVCRTALINPALICLEQFGVSFSKQTLTIANDL